MDTAQRKVYKIRTVVQVMRKIIVGSDHAGFKLKEKLKSFLGRKGYDVEDYGTHSEEPVDYPDIAFRVARGIKNGRRGILVCGSGVGVSIAANRIKGVRAALADSLKTAKLSREHNDANVLCLSGRMLSQKGAEKITEAFLTTKFSNAARHIRRVRKLG